MAASLPMVVIQCRNNSTRLPGKALYPLAGKEIGDEPQTPFRQSLENTIAFIRRHRDQYRPGEYAF